MLDFAAELSVLRRGEVAVEPRERQHAHDPVLAGEHDAVLAEQRGGAGAEVGVAVVELFLVDRCVGLS